MDLYREKILEHFEHPNNYGKLDNPDVTIHDFNPLCGDEIYVDLEIEKNKLKNIRFRGLGCALMRASASLVTEKVKGMTKEKIIALDKEDIEKLLEISPGPTRTKCILLPLEAIKKGLKVK